MKEACKECNIVPKKSGVKLERFCPLLQVSGKYIFQLREMGKFNEEDLQDMCGG